MTFRSQQKLYIKTGTPYQDAAAAGEAAANPGKCWACGVHSGLQKIVAPTLSSTPLMSINPHHPDEDPETGSLQKFCWKAFKKASPLCSKCQEFPGFHGKMFADPKLLEVAKEAGKKAGKKAGKEFSGCSVCYLSMHEDYIDGIIVPEIHPTKPLFKIGEYEGELVRALRKAFMDAYHDATSKCCSVCTHDDE